MKSASGSQVFELPEKVNIKRLLAGISGNYTIRPSSPEQIQASYFDTFDWRLYAKGFVCTCRRDFWSLRRLSDDALVSSCRSKGKNGFWWQFPVGGFKDHLRDITAERALLSQGKLNLSVQPFNVINADGKTVVHVSILKCQKPNLHLLSIAPLKGYEKAADRLIRYFAGKALAPTANTVFEIAVKTKGREPGDYSSKLNLSLKSRMTAQEAARVIFNHLLETIVRNEEGVRQDLDIEFLHDFRVAIRRTRSGLSQIKGILPADVTESFSSRFAELGKASNRLRDLDVYLFNRDKYYSIVSADFGRDLDSFFDTLEKERRAEHSALVKLMNSNKYRGLLRDWRGTLAAFGTSDLEGPKSSKLALSFSKRLIARRYARIVQSGQGITNDSPDEILHRLRISGKKLRYLLEFFASLYPANEVGLLIKQLKQLQDNLGDFNDLYVQQSELTAYLEHPRRVIPVKTAAAVGVLIEHMKNHQQEVRKHFSEAFAAFSGTANKKRFNTLFKKA